MRLLVTNTRYAQAYSVLRSLRPRAEWVVATQSGRRRGSPMTCHAAWSRLVDRRYRTPSPELDWSAGRIQPDNTEREEAYVRRILHICERERIDTIFPSSDPWVYVFSKNRERFAERGILVAAPDYATLSTPLDKYRTIEAAREVGFPCPRTYLAEDDAAVERAARDLDPPWVIKPRFTYGGQGFSIVDDPAALRDAVRMVRAIRGAPTIQEFIPGREKRNFYVVADRRGEARSIFSPRILRYARRVFGSVSTAVESEPPPPFTEHVRRLVRHIGWWGGLTVQTKIDARDGVPKLMELNPRLGLTLWYRTEIGIDEPAMCLEIARGGDPGSPADWPLGCLLLDPVEDLIALLFEPLDRSLYRLRTQVLGRAPVDPCCAPVPLRELLHTLRVHYLTRRERRFLPQLRWAIRDPLPLLLWTYFRLGFYTRGALRGQFGR